MFITFEGLDFSGKSTQANILVEKLRRNHAIVHFLREPGGTKISERVRDILLDKTNLEMNKAAELLLFSAARAQLVKEVIVPALQRGESVLCDRYYDSTTAYQGFGRGIDMAAVKEINRLATSGVDPDVTFFIDVPINEIERRKEVAGKAFDRMEDSGRSFYERVLNGYREIARTESHRFVTIDGTLNVKEVEQVIWMHIEKKLIMLAKS
jgi:dTMP kinase